MPTSDDAPPRDGATLTRPGQRSSPDLRDTRSTTADDNHLDAPRPRSLGLAWREFAHRYGWRAYALPILVVITVAALLRGTGDADSKAVAGGSQAANTSSAVVVPPPASPSTVLKKDVSAAPDASALKAAALPAGAPYDKSAKQTFRVLPGHTDKVGTGKLYRYSIDVEKGLTGIDLTAFQSFVDKTLSDKRSWSGHGVAMKRVDSGPIDFHISMASSLTVRKYCGYTIHVESSCYISADSIPSDVPGKHVDRVIIDDARWVRGASAYVGDIAQYRRYLINHETGHAIGHNHAHQCLPNGMAPTMMQQTFGLRSTKTGKFCQANPWPYPPGVSGAPGAEQPDTAANNEYGRGD